MLVTLSNDWILLQFLTHQPLSSRVKNSSGLHSMIHSNFWYSPNCEIRDKRRKTDNTVNSNCCDLLYRCPIIFTHVAPVCSRQQCIQTFFAEWFSSEEDGLYISQSVLMCGWLNGFTKSVTKPCFSRQTNATGTNLDSVATPTNTVYPVQEWHSLNRNWWSPLWKQGRLLWPRNL